MTRAYKTIPGRVDSPVRIFASVGSTPRFTEQVSGYRVTSTGDTGYAGLVRSRGPALLGHAHPGAIAAVQSAAAKGLSFGTPADVEVKLAERIRARIPVARHMGLVSTGTEATMTAVRIVRGATGRDKIVKFAGCYHDHSDALLAAAESGVATQGLSGNAGVTVAAAADIIVLAYNSFNELHSLFKRIGGQIAAIIMEAVPVSMGVVTPTEGFNAKIRRLTTEHGALVILGEVLTGFRVGTSG